MQRREFLTVLAAAAASARVVWPGALRAQDQASSKQSGGDEIGQVATLQGSATVTRGSPAAPAGLRVNDVIFKNDMLETSANSTLGISFDDETTFSLSANTRITVDEFVYQQSGSANAALFTVARGTAAFLASKVASTGDMKIATPIATMGIRGTTGVVDVLVAGTAGEPKIKLYPDADGHVGRIEVFDRQGARLGTLTQGASAFALRAGPGGRFAAVPFQIPPQEALRDRGVLQRLSASHAIGQRQTIQRRQLHERNRQRPNELRRPGGPREQQNIHRRPGGQPTREPRAPGPQRAPRAPPRKPNPSGQKRK
jgi:FecR protein